MSESIATYSFLPWLRRGIANTIISADGDQSVKLRSSIQVQLTLSGDAIASGPTLTKQVTQKVALYGPGDIVGIDPRAIVRTEPYAWVTNFEANYLPYIEFYDEDFPWRYTPAAPTNDGLRLRPWLALVVLAEDEFTEGKNVANRPLPYISIADASVFPPAEQLWAWAHIHFNTSLSAGPSEVVSSDVDAVLTRVKGALQANPDVAYSRLICPRFLAANTGYHAFVLPVFETGRLAGLGLNPASAAYATASAWQTAPNKPEATNYPVYYRWYFRTGSGGDFEYLLHQLKPQPLNKRVGTRDFDVLHPGSNLPGITDEKLNGILRIGGALRVPRNDPEPPDPDEPDYAHWYEPYPHPFQQALARFLSLPDDYAVQSAAAANTAAQLGQAIADDPDPLITAPIYGCWHALTRRLLKRRDGSEDPYKDDWVHELNLDPQHRATAHFGAQVVETNQEEYMRHAWEQVGDVLAANAQIRRLQLAKEVSWRWYERDLLTLVAVNPERAFSLMAPVASRVLTNGGTISYLQQASLLPPVYTSTVLRRVVRPRSRLLRQLSFTGEITPGNLLSRVNAGEVSAAPPKEVSPNIPTLNQVASAAGTLEWVIREENQTPESVDRYPLNPDFVLTIPGTGDHPTPQPGTNDGPIAKRTKEALRDSFEVLVTGKEVSTVPDPVSLDLPTLINVLVEALDPQVSIPKRGLSTIYIPQWIRELIGEEIREVMVYPKIDQPMYEPLKALSIELFLPNIEQIPTNSITLIETNPQFIEAYMVGLNHEFARKLLWREYPTDQRGSYFRQFWDKRSYYHSGNLSGEELKEKLYDITELHHWSHFSRLGEHNNRAPCEHNNRAPSEENSAQAVLVIRGELLKKYPGAVLYAQRAQWARNSDNSINPAAPRSPIPLTEAAPPREKVRTPIYEAKVNPDIYFFGFDLTVAEARGGSGEKPDDDPGWFFVLKERPGEPRFGLELTREEPLETFDGLTWNDALPGAVADQFLSATSLSWVSLALPPSSDSEDKKTQHNEDMQVDNTAVSSARWAYLLYRPPVIVAIHASEMLTT